MIITIHVKPNAKVTRVVGVLDVRTFIIALHAPATEGKANDALITFLSEALDIAKTFIVIKRGHGSRIKQIEIPDDTSLAALRG